MEVNKTEGRIEMGRKFLFVVVDFEKIFRNVVEVLII